METVMSNEAVVVSVAVSAYESKVMDNTQEAGLNLQNFCLVP